VNYESVQPYPLEEIHVDGWNADSAGAYRAEKISYAAQRPNLDTSRIIYNAGVTLSGIPDQAHQYLLGSRSALDWIIDRYQVKTDSKSGVVNDPNDWATEHGEPRYIIDLIKRITTVSVRTVEIVQGLPQLPI
jgi:predicted helicase